MSDGNCPENVWSGDMGPCVCNGRVHKGEAMTLPTREEAQRLETMKPDDQPNLGAWVEIKVAAKEEVWQARLDGVLMTHEEWATTIDYEAMADATVTLPRLIGIIQKTRGGVIQFGATGQPLEMSGGIRYAMIRLAAIRETDNA